MAIPGLNYKLTKPSAIAVAEYFGPRHGISRIGGWRAVGSVPGSNHPKGLALDFITRDKAKGDRLANDLIANHKAWGITEVIWWRRIWTPSGGWRAYNGPSAHTDHVHASVSENGKVPSTGGVIPVGSSFIIPDSIENAAKFLTDPAVYRKVALYVLGSVLLTVGFFMLFGGPIMGLAKGTAKGISKAGKVIK